MALSAHIGRFLALVKGSGLSRRANSSGELDVLYVAVRSNEIHHTDNTSHLVHPLIARASRPMKSIAADINELRLAILSMVVLSLMTVLLVGTRILTKTVQGEQQKLEKRVENRTTEISILQTFTDLLNACSTFKDAGEVISNVIPKLLPEFKGSVSIIKSSRNRLDTVTQWGEEWPGCDRFTPSECWALRKGHQHLSNEYGIQTFCSHWIEKPQCQTLCIPLLAQGETIGVLTFIMDESVPIDEYRHIWSAIADEVGLTLANIQLRDNLREQAIRDPLTGLFNRRYMLEALEQAHSRSERKGHSIAILMIDLDHFKLFNDNFGHEAGDYVLKATAQVFKDSLRQEDIACRYGGEEFCIVLPDTNENQASLIAERIVKAMSSLELSMNKLSLGTVTASIGIAVFPDNAVTMDDTIRAADEALYLAKENGRNRTEISNTQNIENSRNEKKDQAPEIKDA